MDTSTYGKLYIVATPIGNLKDITLRAIEVLNKVPLVACEDTRKTGFLLSQLNLHLQHKPKLLSYYEQNEAQRIAEIVALLKNGNDIALVSDAGTPTVSDPGFKLVRECIVNGIKVESIPGPSSVISALVSSGLPTDKFMFLGFLPHKVGHRNTMLLNVQNILKLQSQTVIFFEAPHRIVQALEEVQTVFGDIELVLCRELTKLHEEVRRESISASIKHYEKTNPKGEYVVLFHI